MARNIPGRRTVLSPTACGRSPLAEGAKRGGAFYMRPRRFALPQTGTGGYGIRPYVFCRGDHWSPVPVCLVRRLPERTQLRQVGGRAMLAPTFSIGKVDTRFSNGFFLFRLVKNCHIWYTVFLQVHRQTRCKPATQSYRGPSGQPVANKKLLFLLPSAASRPFWGRS